MIAVAGIADLHFGSTIDGYQQVPLYIYVDGLESPNITDWALDQFRKRYQPGRSKNGALSAPACAGATEGGR